MSTEQVGINADVEWLHEIGSQIAAGNTLDEALATTLNFANALVSCDACFIYVRNGAELELSVWKYSDRKAVEHSRGSIEEGCTAFLSKNRVPIAISPNGREFSEFRVFNQWSADPGESFVAVPLLAQEQLAGVINVQHRQPRQYSQREVKLLSSAGFLLGAKIGISRLQSQNSALLQQLETRKLVERGKGVLQRDLGLSEEQSYLMLQRQSRQKRKSMKEIAQAIILADLVKRGARSNPPSSSSSRHITPAQPFEDCRVECGRLAQAGR